MKSLSKTLIAVAVVASLFQSAAARAESVSVQVNATITSVCKFYTSAPVLNISNTGTGSAIDPSSATSATGNVAIAYRCSTGTLPNFTVPGTATVTCAACAGSPTLAPTITSAGAATGSGMGSGQDKTLTATATIAPTAFQNAAAGAYTGAMVVSVNP